MIIRNITKTHRTDSTKDEEEIVGYYYYIQGTFPKKFYYREKIDMHAQDKKGDRYFSEDKNGNKIEAFWRHFEGQNNWFLRTLADGKKVNNLLELPPYQG